MNQTTEVGTANADAPAPNGMQTNQISEGQTQTNSQTADADEKSQQSEPTDFNERLLSESKKFKQRAMAAERELKKLQEQALEEEGKAVERAKYWEEKYKTLNQQTMAQKIQSAIEAKARALGAPNPEAVVKLGNYDIIDYDPDSASVDGVEQFVDDVKKKYPVLFGQVKTPTINPSVPTPGQGGFNMNKDYSNLSKEQILAELKKIGK